MNAACPSFIPTFVSSRTILRDDADNHEELIGCINNFDIALLHGF